jgi:hypothetical protein
MVHKALSLVIPRKKVVHIVVHILVHTVHILRLYFNIDR